MDHLQHYVRQHRTKEEQEEEEMKHLNKRLLIYQVAEKDWEANESQVKAGRTVATSMDLKKEIQQAAAEALEAQQQPKPPAGLPPSQPVMHRQQISRRGTRTRKEPSSLKEHVH